MDFINVKALKGEEGTGFEKRGNKGPFQCDNCTYFIDGNSCNQEDMKKLSRQSKWPNGTVVVDALDCCDFIQRMGQFWKR